MDKSNTRTIYLILLLSLITVSVYANSLRNGFVWDDNIVIKENKWIKESPGIHVFFLTDFCEGFDASCGFYRPMVSLSYLLDYSLWKENPWGYHLTNILFHLLSVLGVFGLAFFLRDQMSQASFPSQDQNTLPFTAALIFSLHPAHVESVAGIYARTDPPTAVFMLGTFLCFAIYKTKGESPYLPWFGLSLFFYVLALLTKEMAVTLPALLLAYDFLFLKSRDKSKFKRFIPHLLFLIPLFFYFLIRHYALGFGVLMKMQWENLPERLLHIPALLFGYLKLMVFPFPMTLFHRPPSVENFPFMDGFLPFIVLAILISIGIYSIRDRPVIGFSLLWFGLTLFPVLNFIPIYFTEGAPAVSGRYAYIPSIGASILLAWCFLQIKTSFHRISPFLEKTLIGLFIIILLASSIITINRIAIFKNDFSLWEYEARRKDYNAFIPQFNYAGLLEQRDRLKEAEEHYLKAIALRWDDVRPYLTLGKIYERMENTEEAFRTYQIAVAVAPNSAEAHFDLGIALIKNGKFHESELSLIKALKLNSNLIKAHRSIGFLYYYQLKQPKKALFHFQHFKRLNPKPDSQMDKALSLLLID